VKPTIYTNSQQDAVLKDVSCTQAVTACCNTT
jgi:hypothetical protein